MANQELEDSDDIWTLIFDFVDAFMSLALAKLERRFACADGLQHTIKAVFGYGGL